ncbi:hypothetical protein BTU63_02495 [Streptococcus rubneri]|nr:hypothetical protein [Streptococcus rubneri]
MFLLFLLKRMPVGAVLLGMKALLEAMSCFITWTIIADFFCLVKKKVEFSENFHDLNLSRLK